MLAPGTNLLDPDTLNGLSAFLLLGLALVQHLVVVFFALPFGRVLAIFLLGHLDGLRLVLPLFLILLLLFQFLLLVLLLLLLLELLLLLQHLH